MSDDRWAPYGAAAGAIAIAMFVVASLLTGNPPDFDAPGEEVAAWFEEERTRIQIGAAIHAAWTPLFVWFLATVASLARARGPGARRAGVVAFGCGAIFIALFLVDVTALTIGALRPQNMAAAPELAAALHDISWLAMGMAAFLAAAVLAAFAVLSLRDGALWPRWLGWLAAIAAPVYALRVGILFTTDGPFAADGALGLYAPVATIAVVTVLASIALTLEVRRSSDPGHETQV